MPADPEGDTPNFRNSGQLNAPSRPGPVIHGLNLRDGATSQGVLADTLKHHFLSDSARRCNPKSPKSPKSAAVSVNASARKVSPSLSRPVPKLVSRTDDAHPKDVQVQEQQLPEVVYTPRMPGDEAPQGLDSRTGTDAVQETLEKEGLLVRVPDFLTKLTGASRNGMRACPKLKPLSLGDRRNEVGPFSHRAHRAKSAAPSIVTVPVSAKQWLLQAIGLQDSEIKDLFKQMESIPQFAAEYVREIRAEWEEVMGRENRVPPNADMLAKDQALLDKVKKLINRFFQVQDISDKQYQMQDFQRPAIKEVDGNYKTREASEYKENIEGLHDMEHVQKSEQISPLTPAGIPEVEGLLRTFAEIESRLTSPDLQQGGLQSTRAESQFGETISDSRRPESPSTQMRHVLPSFIPIEDYIVNQNVLQVRDCMHAKNMHERLMVSCEDMHVHACTCKPVKW